MIRMELSTLITIQKWLLIGLGFIWVLWTIALIRQQYHLRKLMELTQNDRERDRLRSDTRSAKR